MNINLLKMMKSKLLQKEKEVTVTEQAPDNNQKGKQYVKQKQCAIESGVKEVKITQIQVKQKQTVTIPPQNTMHDLPNKQAKMQDKLSSLKSMLMNKKQSVSSQIQTKIEEKAINQGNQNVIQNLKSTPTQNIQMKKEEILNSQNNRHIQITEKNQNKFSSSEEAQKNMQKPGLNDFHSSLKKQDIPSTQSPNKQPVKPSLLHILGQRFPWIKNKTALFSQRQKMKQKQHINQPIQQKLQKLQPGKQLNQIENRKSKQQQQQQSQDMQKQHQQNKQLQQQIQQLEQQDHLQRQEILLNKKQLQKQVLIDQLEQLRQINQQKQQVQEQNQQRQQQQNFQPEQNIKDLNIIQNDISVDSNPAQQPNIIQLQENHVSKIAFVQNSNQRDLQNSQSKNIENKDNHQEQNIKDSAEIPQESNKVIQRLTLMMQRMKKMKQIKQKQNELKQKEISEDINIQSQLNVQRQISPAHQEKQNEEQFDQQKDQQVQQISNRAVYSWREQQNWSMSSKQQKKKNKIFLKQMQKIKTATQKLKSLFNENQLREYQNTHYQGKRLFNLIQNIEFTLKNIE